MEANDLSQLNFWGGMMLYYVPAMVLFACLFWAVVNDPHKS